MVICVQKHLEMHCKSAGICITGTGMKKHVDSLQNNTVDTDMQQEQKDLNKKI